MNLHQQLTNLLKEFDTPYTSIEHASTMTCAASAAARGEDKKIGGKTLLLKDKLDFRLFVMSAALNFDSQKARQILKSHKLRFATKEELLKHTGAISGALPPFGRPLQNFDLYIDPSVLDNDKIAFNAGLLTCSFIMNTQDWYKLVKDHAQLASFTKKG